MCSNRAYGGFGIKKIRGTIERMDRSNYCCTRLQCGNPRGKGKKKGFSGARSNGERAIYSRQIYLIRSVQMKNSGRMKKIAQIGICVKGPTLCTNEWQNLPTTGRSPPVMMQPCVSIPDRPRCIFALLHADGRTDGCIDRPDTIARASFFRAFFLPGPSPVPVPLPPCSKPTFILDNFDGCF